MSLTRISRDGHVATLHLDRPEARNALSVALCDAIVGSLQEIDASDARVVVIRGEGKAFCAGADFAAVSGPGALEFLPAFERMLEAVGRFRLPVIAALHGAALGGGLQLATVCDFRIAATDARLGIPSSRLGIVVNFENVRRLVHLAGISAAKQILLTGRELTGAEAAARGLVDDAVDPGELDAAVGALAERIAALAPKSVQGAKRSIQEVADHMSGAPSDEVVALVADAYASSDLQEGLAAMSEKRPPRFTGS